MTSLETSFVIRKVKEMKAITVEPKKSGTARMEQVEEPGAP